MDATTHFHVTQLLSRMYAALDEKDFARVAACFHPQGRWERLGATLQGPAEVLRALDQRSKTLLTQHSCTNLWLSPGEPGAVRARFVLTVHQRDTGSVPAQPGGSPPPRVGFCDAEFAVSGAEVLLTFLRIRPPLFAAGD